METNFEYALFAHQKKLLHIDNFGTPQAAALLLAPGSTNFKTALAVEYGYSLRLPPLELIMWAVIMLLISYTLIFKKDL